MSTSTPPSSMGEESNSACESNSTYESTSIHESISMGDGELKGACNYCPKHINLQNDKVTTECTLSHGMPCPPCARQMKLKAEIEETKKILDKLIAQERQARMDMNHYHDPLNRLPAEIISHIFCFAVPEFQLQEEKKWPPSEPGALVLGGVCHMWREIAWSTPQLWSTIMLSRIHYPPTDNMNDVVEKWLQRSRKLPLSIRLYLSNRSLYYLENSGRKREHQQTLYFIDLFLERFSHWQDLSVQSDAACLFDQFDHCVQDDSNSRNIPHHLKTLQLVYPHTETPGPRFFLDCEKPWQAEHVILSGFPAIKNVGVSWNSATDITITGFQFADYIQLLQVASKLVNLTINSVFIPHNPSVPNPPLKLHNIRTFSISAAFKDLKIILDGIELPLLEKLSIHGLISYHGLQVGRGPFYSIIRFLERSSCPLTSCILRFDQCRDKVILDLLDALPPTVKTLELDLRHPHSSRYLDPNLPVVFGHLSRFSNATDETPRVGLGLLPHLESFTYSIDHEHTRIPWHLLPTIACPVFGEKRALKNLSICQRTTHFSRSTSPGILLSRRTDINEDIIRDLINLADEGVELYLLTGFVTPEGLHKTLLESLEPCDISQLETL